MTSVEALAPHGEEPVSLKWLVEAATGGDSQALRATAQLRIGATGGGANAD